MPRSDVLHTCRAASALASFLLAQLQICEALVSSGSVVLPANGTFFLEKFCFTFEPPNRHAGYLTLVLRAPEASLAHSVRMLLFDDELHSYAGPSREWDALSCEQRALRARAVKGVPSGYLANGRVMKFDINQKLRPRWWFAALDNCDSDDLVVSWTLHATNNGGYGWAEEFSADKRYSLHVFAFLAAVYICLVPLQLRVNRVLAQTSSDSARGKAAHPFARILLAGLALALGEAVLCILHLILYARNGYGLALANVFSQLLAVASNFVLASLLLLISEGKCISRVMVSGDARRMLSLLGPFLVSCFVLELWGEYSVSRNYTTDYVYNTPFGWALIAVDVGLLVLYSTNLWRTYCQERDPDDARFYRRWGLIYALWFLALPVVAVLAQVVFAPYVWYIVSLSVKKGVTALVYMSLVFGLWPENVHTRFKLKQVIDRCSHTENAGAGFPVLLTNLQRVAVDDRDKRKIAMSP